MNVGLRQLRAFLAVAKHGSFSRAAEEVAVSQSAVSFSVQQLESELGLRLLDRTTRQVRLTAVGETLAASGTRLLDELDTVLRELKDTGERRRGKVMLACVPSVARGLMPACVAYCRKKWPEVTFSIEDIAAKEVIARVTRGDVEFGLSGGDIEATELHVENLMQDPFVLACRRDDALTKSKTIPWAKLSERQLVMLNNTSGSRPQILDTLAKAGVQAQIALELAQPSSVLAMVDAGLGIAVIPTLVAPIETHPTLTTRRLVKPTVSRTIFLVRRRDRSLSPAASAVWAALIALFAASEHRSKERLHCA